MNINLEQQSLEMCLKSINQIGSTTYQNICTGESSVVFWGSGDWVAATLFYLLIIGVALLILVIVGVFVKMAWEV